jgi:hypothetical protein
MQTYFNHDDADIETQSAISGSPREHFFAGEFTDGFNSGYSGFIIVTAVLGLFLLLFNANLSSSVPSINTEKPEVLLAHTFEIKIPEPVPPKPKVEPKKEKPKPKDRKPPTRRKPEVYASTIKPEPEKKREIKTDEVREQIDEQATTREVPRIETPMIEPSEFKTREDISQEIRHVSASAGVDTVRQYSYGGIEARNEPTVEVSHSELDEYTYQMVNVCLRLCAQSIFLREAEGLPAQNYPREWLKVEKGNVNSIWFKYNGSWLKLSINTGRLTVLSDLSYIEIPADFGSAASNIDDLFGEVTKKLCRLLQQEDCLENL